MKYEKCPKGYVRVWVVTASNDDERYVYELQSWARDKAADLRCEGNSWNVDLTVTVTPLDIPAGALPGIVGGK